jgi:hypothetical protein
MLPFCIVLPSCLPVEAFQTLAVLSPEVVMTRLPSLLKTAELSNFIGFSSLSGLSVAAVSQTRAMLSPEVVMTRLPSLLKTAE